MIDFSQISIKSNRFFLEKKRREIAMNKILCRIYEEFYQKPIYWEGYERKQKKYLIERKRRKNSIKKHFTCKKKKHSNERKKNESLFGIHRILTVARLMKKSQWRILWKGQKQKPLVEKFDRSKFDRIPLNSVSLSLSHGKKKRKTNQIEMMLMDSR